MTHPFQDRLRIRKNQEFLHQLYQLASVDKKKRDQLIDHATRENIDILLRVLRLILKKEIPIKSSDHFDTIKRSRRLPHMVQHFLDDHTFRNLKVDTLEKKRNVLRQITTYKELLSALFY
jgi:hypothetical protein